MVRRLLAAGLLDELHLLVHPIAIRNGMRLFDEGESPIPLPLVSSQAFTPGVLHLIYAPAESTPAGTYDETKATCPRPRTVRATSSTARSSPVRTWCVRDSTQGPDDVPRRARTASRTVGGTPVPPAGQLPAGASDGRADSARQRAA